MLGSSSWSVCRQGFASWGGHRMQHSPWAMATLHLQTAPSCSQTQGVTEDGSGQLRDEAASGGSSAVV